MSLDLLVEKYKSAYLSKSLNENCFAKFRDEFNARLDVFISTSNLFLVSALLGEIGNNSFDHNYIFQKDCPRGVFFLHDEKEMYSVLADYGNGIRATLSKVRPSISSDMEALNLAFTQMISGRAPEQRGNGLKFVLKTVVENKWSLYYQSGCAKLKIINGKIDFSEDNEKILGCFAILKWSK